MIPATAPTIGGNASIAWPVGRRTAITRTDEAERAEADDADPSPPPGDRAQHQCEQPDHDEHADAQRDLVVRTELLDGEVLQPDRRAIDELGTHGVARRLRIAEQPGEEVADAERERGREQAPRVRRTSELSRRAPRART